MTNQVKLLTFDKLLNLCETGKITKKQIDLFILNGATSNELSVLLMTACNYGHVKVVKFLLKYKIDINNRDNPKGLTPLMYASFNGYIDIVKFLDENGADLYAKYRTTHTALDLAAMNGHQNIVDYLEEKISIKVDISKIIHDYI